MEFPEQIKFFKEKINIPTQRWDDLLKESHNQAFTIAGVMKADLLNDIRNSVSNAIQKGISLNDFQKSFNKITDSYGWQTNKWRSWVVYNTNMFASYNAGRFEQLIQSVDTRPYWRYKHNDAVINPRPLHVKWNNIVLHYTNNWWKAHFPPGGFGCKCYIESLSEDEIDPTQIKSAPDDGEYSYTSPAGETELIPNGVDPGWNYIPASVSGIKSVLKNNSNPELKAFLMDTLKKNQNKWDDIIRKKAESYPPQLRTVFLEAMKNGNLYQSEDDSSPTEETI